MQENENPVLHFHLLGFSGFGFGRRNFPTKTVWKIQCFQLPDRVISLADKFNWCKEKKKMKADKSEQKISADCLLCLY